MDQRKIKINKRKMIEISLWLGVLKKQISLHFGIYNNKISLGFKVPINKFHSKRPAQAAVADPSQCNSTNRQNPPFEPIQHF